MCLHAHIDLHFVPFSESAFYSYLHAALQAVMGPVDVFVVVLPTY